MKRLFLDDERNPIDVLNYDSNPIYNLKWNVVRNFSEFKTYIENNGLPDIISFDHDLGDFDGDKEYTGYDAVKWLIDLCIDNSTLFPRYLIHTRNIVGAENIRSYINSYLKTIW